MEEMQTMPMWVNVFIGIAAALGGFELINDGLAKLWVPDNEALADCVEYGRQLAQAL